MNIGDFKTYLDVIGRFASIRENADEPSDRVLIQSVAGHLKLVAGSSDRTVVVDCGVSGGEDVMVVVAARPLIQWAKGLRGRGGITLSGGPSGVQLDSSTGASLSLPNITNQLPGYIRPPAITPFTGVPVPSDFWPDVVKVIETVAGDVPPYDEVALSALDDTITLTAAGLYTFAELGLTNQRWVGFDGHMGGVPASFFESLRPFREAGDLTVDKDRVMVRSGFYTAVVKLNDKNPGLPPHDTFVVDKTTRVVVDKRQLVDMVKGVSTQDEHGRVRLTTSKDRLRLSPWGAHDVGVEMPAKVEGKHGTVGVTADLFSKMASAMTGSEAAFSFNADVQAELEYRDGKWPWRTALATVAL